MGRLATFLSPILTLTQPMKITGYTGSSGPLHRCAIPSDTRSVIVEIVCLDTSAPYTSGQLRSDFSWVSPFADSDSTRSSTPDSRR